MTKSDWLSAANITMEAVTMLVSPLWGWWIIKLITQPKPNPAENTDTKRPNWIVRLIGSTWFLPWIVILVGLYEILKDIRSTAPLTRHAVLDIAIDVALVVYGLAGFSIVSIVSILRGMVTVHGGTLSILKDVVETMKASSAKTPRRRKAKEISN